MLLFTQLSYHLTCKLLKKSYMLSSMYAFLLIFFFSWEFKKTIWQRIWTTVERSCRRNLHLRYWLRFQFFIPILVWTSGCFGLEGKDFPLLLIYLNKGFLVKFGYSEKATKFEKNLPFKIWRYSVTSNFKWKIFSHKIKSRMGQNFVCLFVCNRGNTILHHGGLLTNLNQCNQGS